MRRIILSTVVALFLMQCATVTRGPMQRIRVGSLPAGASVELSECGVGSTDSAITPATVFVNRRATECTLIFNHPDHGTRTVPLLRKGRAVAREGPPEEAIAAAGGTMEVAGAIMEVPVVGPVFGVAAVGAVVIGGVIWGLSRSVDGISGANYEHSGSTILVDFHKPVPNVAGRYVLARVNGQELPIATWTKDVRANRQDYIVFWGKSGKCQLWAKSGSLSLDESGRWTSSMTEQEICGKKTYRAETSTAHGVFTAEAVAEGVQVLLESENAVSPAMLQADRLDITANGVGPYAGQTVIYTFQLAP